MKNNKCNACGNVYGNFDFVKLFIWNENGVKKGVICERCLDARPAAPVDVASLKADLQDLRHAPQTETVKNQIAEIEQALAEQEPEQVAEGCPVCTGRQSAKASLVVRCYNCKCLLRHSAAEYSSSYGDYTYHHFCKHCEALNVRDLMIENASEIRAERLNEQFLYKYEIESFEAEDWKERFIAYLKRNNLPLAWA